MHATDMSCKPGRRSRRTQRRAAPRAGPFVTVIFADSLAGLFNAAPLLLATQPWYYASWRLVFTIIGFQARRPGRTRSGVERAAACLLLAPFFGFGTRV